jgi:hypothetical protein
MEVSGQLHAPAALPSGKDPSTHWIGRWVDSAAGLNEMAERKSLSPCRESKPGRLARNLVTILGYGLDDRDVKIRNFRSDLL